VTAEHPIARAVDEFLGKHNITAHMVELIVMCSMWNKAPGEPIPKGPQRVSVC
jgi:hypothetical protein